MSPVPTFTGLGPNPQFEDIVRKVNTLVNELRQLMLGMDSVNMFEVGGWLVTQDELASQDGDVGMSTAGTIPTSIRFWAGNAIPASAPFRVQQDGKMVSSSGAIGGWVVGATSLLDVDGVVGMSSEVTAGNDIRFWAGDAIAANAEFRVYEDGTMYATAGNFTGIITGGTLQTAVSGNRIVITNNSLKTYNGANLNGFAWGTDVAGATFGDAFLYHAGSKLLEFRDNFDSYSIRGGIAAIGMILGWISSPTTAEGAWTFVTAGSVEMNGTFKVHAGTAFDTITQANTSGLTLAQLETELNTLKGNLRAMNILA